MFNGLIAWMIFRSATAVPLWGASSVAVDLLATAFLLPFLTCVIASPIVRRHVRDGKVPPLATGELPYSRWFERSTLSRGLLLGAAGLLFSAVPVVWALGVGQAQPFPVSSYVAYKAVWAAMLACLVTPVVGWWALVSASGSPAKTVAGSSSPD